MPYNFAFSCETIIYTSVHQIQIGSLASNIKKKKKGEGVDDDTPMLHPCTSTSLWSLPASTQMGRLLQTSIPLLSPLKT